ncbi:unnamed protein product [Phytophthora fragariaefolia]|uniref:Unnamed protein product n=1 Tax=Phytophthora fragariaefolia TaxID=1490495 RepID=A0A9W7D0S1_9STRA|nr:unnamed protein product [Phytophthora fragariaefolia]
MVHAFNKLNATTIPASTPIPRKDVLQNNIAGCTVFSALDMVDGYYQLLMRESDIPLPAKDLRKWLGLANYLHKYSANYADMARPLTYLRKNDAVWSWTSETQQAFEAIKRGLQGAPILASPDEDRLFSVVCDASDFAIGCALLQVDAEGREQVVSFQSRQLKAAEKKLPYPRQRTFGDEVCLGPVSGAPVRSKTLCDLQRSCLVEDSDVVALPLSAHGAVAFVLRRLIREAYAADGDLAGLVEAVSVPNKTVELTARQRSRLHRYSVVEGLFYYQVNDGDELRIGVPNDEDLRHRVLYEAHDTPLSGHLGREKAYTSVARNFWWSHMYKWVRKYVQTCDTCQRVKPAPSASAPLMSLPVPADCWRSVSMDFIFELPADARGHTGANAEVPRGLKGLKTSVKRNLLSFIETDKAVRQRVRDTMAVAHDRQKENSDRYGRANTQVFQVGDQVLLNAKNLPIAVVSEVGSTKLRRRFIGPFTVIGVHGYAYTLDLPSAMATHPTFYVGLLKPYHPAAAIDPSGSALPSIDEGHSPPLPAAPPSQEPALGRIAQRDPLGGGVAVLQGADTRVERPDPAEMLGQGMLHLPDDPHALRQSATHPIQFSTKVVHLLRQPLHTVPQATQDLGNFSTILNEGLDRLKTPTQRHQVRPLGIQKSLTAFHGR